MLVSSVQSVVACNATAPRVCTLVLFKQAIKALPVYEQGVSGFELYYTSVVYSMHCTCTQHFAVSKCNFSSKL